MLSLAYTCSFNRAQKSLNADWKDAKQLIQYPLETSHERNKQQSPTDTHSLKGTSLKLLVRTDNFIVTKTSCTPAITFHSVIHCIPTPTQTYHNGHIDLPSDEDLRNIATKVTHCVQGDWTALQATLDIPDYTMLDVLSQRSIELQVYR